MEMQQIRYFLALAQTLNFTRAAEAANVSQPALTRAIQALEAELGGELIRRERGHSHLTALGQRMLPLLQQCHDAAVDAQRLARAVRSSDVAPLALGFSRGVNMAAFVAPMSELFRAFPGAQLKIRRGGGADIVEMMKAGEVELAVAGPLDAPWERLERWTLFEERLRLAVHREHRLARQNAISADQLAGERLLDLAGCETGAAIRAALIARGVNSTTTHEVESDHDLAALLHANAGISVLPVSAPAGPSVVHPAIADWQPTREVAAYAVAGRARSPVCATLLNLLRAADWSAYEP